MYCLVLDSKFSEFLHRTTHTFSVVRKTQKMKYLLILCLFYCNLFYSQKTDECYNEIKNHDLNYSICLDNNMSLDIINENEILIKQYEKNVDYNLTRQISVLKKVNFKEKNNIELWSNEFGNKIIDGLNLTSKTEKKISLKNYDFHIVNKVYKDDKNEISTHTSAVGTCNDLYYSLETYGLYKENNGIDFLLKILNKSKLSCDSELSRDFKLKKDFLLNFSRGVKNREVLNELLITAEIYASSVDKSQISKEDLNALQPIIKRWNKSVYDFTDSINRYKKIDIINYYFTKDDSDPKATTYIASLSLKCDDENITSKILCIEFNRKLYLSMVM